VAATLRVLADAGRPLSTAAIEPLVDLRRNRLEMMLKVLDVDGAVRRVRGGWISTGVPWVYDADRYARVAAVRASEQQAMRDYVGTAECRMSFLQRQLDDSAQTTCGRCDNCGGVALPPDVSEAALASAQSAIHQPGVLVEPRRMWPTGLASVGLDESGRIPAALCAEPGRALGRLSDIGWGARLREVFAGPDAAVPDDVFDGLVQVLARWEWQTRPAGIVTIRSRSRPLLVASLGERLAAVGRLPLHGEVTRAGLAGSRMSGSQNSAQRVRALHGTFELAGSLSSNLSQLAGPVLLVDDLVDSGWTMTLVAALLREAGAVGVLPLALAVA
jgi:ATP-dependent DNA helicase RecQ